ncbi:MAG: DUF2281 domain-containing protein [Candidatus Methylumidiphilus sp.]
MNTAEQIYEHVKALPEYKALEVLDFVEFLEQKPPRRLDEKEPNLQDWLKSAWGCCPDFPERLPDPPPPSVEPL